MAEKEKARAIRLSIVASINFLLWITGVYLQLPDWVPFMNMAAVIYTGSCAVISWRSWEKWKTEISQWVEHIMSPPRRHF